MSGRGKGGRGLGQLPVYASGIPPLDDLKRSRDEREQFKTKKRKILNKTQISNNNFEDLSFGFVSAAQSDESLNRELMNFKAGVQLSDKLCEHSCHDDKCFRKCPKINWNSLPDFDCNYVVEPSEEGGLTFTSMQQHQICDEGCSEETIDYILRIVDEFIAEQEDFEAMPVTRIRDEASVFEFKSCGKRCVYVRHEEGEYEVCFLLISDLEFVFGGYSGGHPFYGTPVLRYDNSDGSSPAIIPVYDTNFNHIERES